MRRIRHSKRSKELVCTLFGAFSSLDTDSSADAKAKAELAAKAKGSKGPLNTGSQGIKKSGKK